MKLKGHATFELNNVETGEKRVIEEDNLVTNFFEKMCIQTGMFGYDFMQLYKCSQTAGGLISTDKFTEFFHGLILFEEPVDEDPDNIWPRSGNRMVGQGVAEYAGSSVKTGTFNVNESGSIENGVKYVWDFGTSKSNGQISCACLTTWQGGLCGMGSEPDLAPSDFKGRFRIFSLDSSRHSYINSINVRMPQPMIAIDYNEGVGYAPAGWFGMCYSPEGWQWDYGTECNPYSFVMSKKINILKYELPMTKLDFFTPAPRSTQRHETLSFNMPQEIIDSIVNYDTIFSGRSYGTRSVPACFNYWDKHIYVYIHFAGITTSNKNSSRTLSPNDDFYIIDLDLVNKTSSALKYKNTTGASLTNAYGSSGGEASCGRVGQNATDDRPNSFDFRNSPIYVTDEWLIMHMSNGKVYRVSRKDNTNVVEFKQRDAEGNLKAISFGDPLGNYDYHQERRNSLKFYPLGTTLEQIKKNKVVALRANSPYLLLFDFNEATVEFLSSGKDIAYWIVGDGCHLTKIWGTDYFCVTGGRSVNENHVGGNYGSITIFPNFMTTINNLSTPVVKTAAETMKVTYTITQVKDKEV